jgi:putative ABC transport system permease protein
MSILVLSLGLVSFVTALAIVDYWRSSERQFAKADRIYVITRNIVPDNGDSGTGALPRTPLHLAQYLLSEFPQLQAATRVLPDVDVGVTAGERAMRLNRLVVDPEFGKVFDLSYVEGSPNEALLPGGAVLTHRGAQRLFGSEDPLGRTVTFANIADTTVTGIIAPIQAPSHMEDSPSAMMRFDVLASWSVFEELVTARNPNYFQQPEDWRGGRFITYVLLPDDGSLTGSEFRSRLASFAERHVPPEQLIGASIIFDALPIRSMITANLDAVLFGPNAAYLSVTSLLVLLGALILAVSCLNYASIAAARGVARAREIAVKKALGASKRHVIAQFLVEAALLTIAAFILSILVLALLVGVLREGAGIDLTVSLFAGYDLWFVLIALIAVVSILAGAYPASVLSSIRPIESLRLRQHQPGSRTVSALLVGSQFAVTSFLVIGVIVTFLQNSELRRTGLGMSADPLLMIDNPTPLTGVSIDSLRAELMSFPHVVGVTSVSQRPWDLEASLVYLSRSVEVGAEQRPVFYNFIGEDFPTVFDIQLLAGREFSRDRGEDAVPCCALDPTRTTNIMVDLALTEELGFESPNAAVNHLIYEVSTNSAIPLRIIGVLENRPLHFIGLGATSNIYAFGLQIENEVVRMSRNDISGALATVNAVWQHLSPNMSLSSYFVDDLFEQAYDNFRRVNLVFISLALFALFISAMGLSAMAVHVSNGRIPEIGIRKALGATTPRIMTMLLRDFSKPVLIGSLIAWPLSFVAANAFLDVFLHRISLTPWPFIMSLLLTMALAWCVVGGQALRASRARPSAVLRAE